MSSKLLIAAAMLAASSTALAHGGPVYGRVVTVEPRVSISFGTGYHDGFRVLYESGGQHYWTYTPVHPGPVILLPPPHRVQPIYYYPYRDRHGWDHRRGWDDRRDWRDDRHGWGRHDRRHERY